MAQRVVKLKSDKPSAGPAIRVRRSKPGDGSAYPFLVGYVDEKGGEDFRSLEEHTDYDVALKAAEARAHQLRISVRNDTGVEAEKPIAPRQVKGTNHSIPAPVPSGESVADLPPVSTQFRLPSIDNRIRDIEVASVLKRSSAMHREDRDDYLARHAELYGDTRNHTCTYTQKTHDQIQGQIAALYDLALTAQAVAYAYLEKTFDRIEQLERNALTVDSFDAQVADDDRTIELAFGNGEQRKVASFKWPVPIYRGIHKSGQQYEAGDMVTADGSGWIAQRSTTSKPGTPNSGFQLAIKRGRDGRDGKDARQ
jgi:hypothetical protein